MDSKFQLIPAGKIDIVMYNETLVVLEGMMCYYQYYIRRYIQYAQKIEDGFPSVIPNS